MNTSGYPRTMTTIAMLFAVVATMMQTAVAENLSPLYALTLPTEPEMTLTIFEDTNTKDIKAEFVLDEDNKYTAFVEIGDLLQGKILTADLKVYGYRTVNGVDMEEDTFLEVENIGPMVMGFVLNPLEGFPYDEMLSEFMNNAVETLPSTEDTVFWQAASTALQKWVLQGSKNLGGENRRQLLEAAAAAGATRGLRGL